MVGTDNFYFSSSVNEEIVEITVSGKLSEDDLEKLRSKVIEVTKGSVGRGLIVDVRNAIWPQKIGDLYFSIRNLPTDVKIKPCAIVGMSEFSDYLSFLETTAANVGLKIKWFEEIEGAREWLKYNWEGKEI